MKGNIMEPVQPVNQSSNTTQLYSNPAIQAGETQFGTAMATASSRLDQSADQWELEENARLDRYRQGLQKLLDDALVDQAFAAARISILISTLAIERMRDDPEFESRILNSLYNGMHAATYLAVPAYFLFKVRSDGTIETSSGGEETMPDYEEEKIHAFWTRHPVDENPSSTDSPPMAHERKPRARRKLDRRRIRVWLERRRRQFLAKQQALLGFLAGIGRRSGIAPESAAKSAGDDQAGQE